MALNNISFVISSGEKIAIVGKNGSGKSSILNAIYRIYEIENYKDSYINISGINIKQIKLIFY